MKINRYKTIKLLGEGGMGSVYLSEDLANSNRLTAIKTILPKFWGNPRRLVNFKHEYEIMSRLWHPNLVLVYDFSELDDGGYYLAMEYIQGKELSELILDKKMELKEALPIMVEILRVIEFVHSRNIIYCDIKPQNILITDDNRIKLIDFGLSDFGDKVSKTIKGTIKYISPEVVNRNDKDHRSDIFSLGVLFYEMLSGKFFYTDSSETSIISKLTSRMDYRSITDMTFENLKEPGIKMIIEKMCAYDSNDRFSSCAEVISALNKELNLNISIETDETKEAYVTGVPFTAREKELEYLKTFLESDENKLLTIMGDQGVGKSKLLNEFQKHCNLEGVVFLEASSANGESYEPFLEILTKLLFRYSNHLNNDTKKYLHKLLPSHPVFSLYIPDKNEIMDPKTLKDILFETISSLIIDYSKSVKSKVVLVFKNFNRTDENSLEIVNEILYKIKVNNINNLKLFAECRTEDGDMLADFFIKLKQKDRIKAVKLEEFSIKEVQSYIYNTFGAKVIHPSITKKIPKLHKYCGGNPFFLKELLKNMVSDGVINRNGNLWELKGSSLNLRISTDLRSVIKKRIDKLKLSDAFLNGFIFMSFSRQEKLSVEFYQKYAQSEIDILWQSLFDLLVKKEFLVYKDEFYVSQNQLFKDVLSESLSENEIVGYHKMWSKILEKKCPLNFKADEIETNLLFDLGYHYRNAKFTDIDIFLKKTAAFLFEMGIREKEKYANKRAINCFSMLLEELDKFELDSVDLLKLKAEVSSNLAQVYDVIGKWDKAEEQYHRAEEQVIKIDDKKSIADLKCKLGLLVMNRGRYDEALSLFEEAITIAEAIGDKKNYASAVGCIGNVYLNKGDYNKAMKCYIEKKQICTEIGDRDGYSKTIGNIGVIYWNTGDFDQAMQCYEEKKQICLELGDKRGHSIVTGNMGSVYYYNGDHEKAMQCYQERKQICLELGDKRGLAGVIGNIGIVNKNNDDFVTAIQCYEEQKQIYLELGDQLGYAGAVGNIGSVFHDKKEYDKALPCYEEQKRISLEFGDKRNYLITIGHIGRVHDNLGNIDMAIQNYDEAIEIARTMQVKPYLCEYLLWKAELLFGLKDYYNSELLNQEANQVAIEVKRGDIVFDSKILDSKLVAINDPDTAVEQLTNMLGTETEELDLAVIHYEIYKINHSINHRQKALEIYQNLYTKIPIIEYKTIIDELNLRKHP